MIKDEFCKRLNLEKELINKSFQRAQVRQKGYSTGSKSFVSLCDEYLSLEDYVEIVAFRKFIERESSLSDEQIQTLVLLSKEEFPAVYDLLVRLPDSIDELRAHTAVDVIIEYKTQKYRDAKKAETSQEKADEKGL